MSQFLLLLYETPTSIGRFKALSPEEMQKAIEKYMAWAKKPFTVDSKRLAGQSEANGPVEGAVRAHRPVAEGHKDHHRCAEDCGDG